MLYDHRFLYDVAYADKILEVSEERLIRRIADLIKIKDIAAVKRIWSYFWSSKLFLYWGLGLFEVGAFSSMSSDSISLRGNRM